MAKLKGPLLSINAHGSIGKRITYSQRASGNQVRFQRANHDRKSASQLSERTLFLEALGKWDDLTNSQKEQWNEFNRGAGAAYRVQKGLITGFHCFMKQYIDFSKAGLAPLKLPDGTLW